MASIKSASNVMSAATVPPLDFAPLHHGGDVAGARALFPGAPEPFLDLSTGINPNPYPLPRLAPEVFARLPQPSDTEALAKEAARAYRAPSHRHVLPAPGTQILLTQLARLMPPGSAKILATTYGEHARAAMLAGHRVMEVTDARDLGDCDLAIVVNPNNPDGRIVSKETLLDLAGRLRGRGGLLVVDEAFMEVGPADASVAGDVADGNIVALRSFGKFFGLAGLRLGFAIGAAELVERLAASLGPWPVSGPAIEIGRRALKDEAWIETTRGDLAKGASRLDALLAEHDLGVAGGTSLFRLVKTEQAAALHQHLGRAGILVRAFPEHPTLLRFGLPGSQPDWARLQAGLGGFRR